MDDDRTRNPALEIAQQVLQELFRTKTVATFRWVENPRETSPSFPKATGFNVDASRTVAPENRAERE